MHRTGTERKTDQRKLPEQERQQKQRTQSADAASEWAQTLSVILSGGSRDQLPAERVQALSGVMGNAALAELFAARSEGPRFSERALPRGECWTAPADFSAEGTPSLVSPPDGSLSTPMGEAQPLAL